MRVIACASLLLIVFSLSACKEQETPTPQVARGFATLYTLGTPTPRQTGDLSLKQENGIVTFTLQLYNLPAGGRHAIHLHEGSCEDPGMHWNGGGSQRYCEVPNMGLPWGRPYLGDIGNIEIDATGKGTLTLVTDLWTMGDGSPQDILGKVLVVHAQPEDFALECDPNHTNHPHTNTKIACGQLFKVVTP